jgi:hypothetical protein
MIRRFNYTGRKRIPRPKISIALSEAPKKTLVFDASVDLDGLQLPGSANIYIEAYRRAYFRRFPCGTISAPKLPKNRLLDGLDVDALILFRVKIADKKGRILAVADKIVPRRAEEERTDRQCLLPVDFVDLGESIWRLDLEGDLPILLLNKCLDNIREVARSDGFFLSLVYPEVVRQVLYKIVVEDDFTDPDADGEDDWMSGWLKFAIEALGSRRLPPSGQSEPIQQEKMKWIDDVVEAFCVNNRMLEKFAKAQKVGES